MNEETIHLPHKLSLNGRKALSVSGVRQVSSFDDRAVVLQTELGMLTVHGEQLQLKNLSLEGGQVAVDGQIAALVYEDPKPERGWLGRFFR